MAVHVITIDSNNLAGFSCEITTFSHVIHVDFFEIEDVHN